MTDNPALWQTKLAARLHDPAEKALVLLRDPEGHENGTSLAAARLLGLNALGPAARLWAMAHPRITCFAKAFRKPFTAMCSAPTGGPPPLTGPNGRWSKSPRLRARPTPTPLGRVCSGPAIRS